MKVAYCSLLLPEEKHLAERSKERLSGISLHKFTRAVIQGLDKNIDEPITVFNIINTINYPKFPQLIFRTENWHHVEGADDWHIGYINLFGIKYITQSLNLYKKLSKWEKALNGEKNIVCVHNIYLPAMQAAYWIKCKYKDQVEICLITGDLTGKYGLQSQYKKNLKEHLIDKMNSRINYLAKKFDSFVFATEPMATALGVEKKPHVVVECAYTAPEYKVDTSITEITDKKILFYAGAIREEYGIPHLLRSFELISDKDYELRLAGDGNSTELVKQFCKKDNRIKYLGFITPTDVDRNQREATALISPRIAGNYEFVKYSFPSKTMESLASGKPYIAHKLPCDPPEYKNYIQYPENDSDEALAKKIIEVCSLSIDERIRIGQQALLFVKNEKNPKVMTRRIVKMWENELYGD